MRTPNTLALVWNNSSASLAVISISKWFQFSTLSTDNYVSFLKISLRLYKTIYILNLYILTVCSKCYIIYKFYTGCKKLRQFHTWCGRIEKKMKLPCKTQSANNTICMACWNFSCNLNAASLGKAIQYQGQIHPYFPYFFTPCKTT